MKEEALKLADELLRDNTQLTVESAYMIRRLVEELDKKPLSDEEIDIIKYAVSSAICSLESEINEQEKTFKGYEHCSNLSGLREELNDCLKAKDILERHGIK